MSTVTHTKRGPDTGSCEPSGRIVSRPLAVVFLAEFCALTSFYLLLSVTPIYATAAGAGSTGAGLVTGVLLAGTVIAELASAVLMRRFAYRTLLVAGAVLLGVPALALHPGSPLGVIVAVSVVRGLGFGLSTVIAGALTAVLLPPERRGEGLGLYGIVATVPGVIALPSGVWLAGHLGGSVVVIMTAVVALVPLAAMPWLRGVDEARKTRTATSNADTQQPTKLLDGIRHGGQLRLALVFAATTVAAGVVVSFLPLADGISKNLAAAGLLAQSLTATVGRWWAGRYGDRHSHRRLLAPALLISSLAMAALIRPTSPIAVLASMAVFGAGFGIVQNATFALMIERMPTSEAGTASALWNLAFDGGYGAGPAAFGLVVGHTGYPAAFVLTGALMAAALPATRSSSTPDQPAP
jgi:predicted MFS family arabinose efflux permease